MAGGALKKSGAGCVLGPTQGEQHGSEVEQSLGGVLVHAVPGIEHRQPRGLLQKVRRSGGKVAQDDALCPQRAQGDAGVFERFALFNGRGLGADERGVGAQTFGRQLE